MGSHGISRHSHGKVQTKGGGGSIARTILYEIFYQKNLNYNSLRNCIHFKVHFLHRFRSCIIFQNIFEFNYKLTNKMTNNITKNLNVITVKIMILSRYLYRPVTIPLPSRYYPVTAPSLTVPHRPSPSLTVPHRPSPSLTVPHRIYTVYIE